MQINSRQSEVVYIHGPSGTGKSHLVTHYLRELLKRHSALQYWHLHASDLHALFVEAAQNKTLPELQHEFQSCELLICEDIQSLDGKFQTQLQLLNVIEFVASHGGQIVVTTTRLPGEFTGLLPRLRNRLHGAICAKLQLPEFRSRIALLQFFAQSKQVPLTEDVVDFLAQKLVVSPRELLGAVLQIDAAARIQQSSIDIRFVERLIRYEPAGRGTSVAQIARTVARIFGVSLRLIRSPSRAKDVLLARQCAMFLARRLTNKKHSEIASYFGRTSHSSVIHAFNRVETLRCKDAGIRQSLIRIEDALKAI